ncbi:universal stress protein UspA [Dokdonia sp. Dokd-P16]|uniref:universal stress protein n=1 Tax=Dokdonia sp. Dokd-P16 TaxID=2173169 RepID=UPI000D544BE9|nr:universal stress protein [Dokdonia sp. Dokd-P16]AWH75580.1 universal stress protein UspA [Dokdonia sp. Dokd-P16]
MKRILIPTDFSEASYNALEYAVQLFINEPCTFYVLNTYTPVALYTTTIYDSHTVLNMDLGEIYKKASLENLNKIILRVTDAYPNSKHTFTAISSYNVLTLELNEIVATSEIDAIIMGTSGASGLKEVFVGSQTMQVVKDAKVPVIGVPDTYRFRALKDVLFTTDYRTGTNQVGLSLLEGLCRKHISRLIFLNAYYGIELDHEQLENKALLDEYFERDAHLNEVADGMDVLEAVADFQSKHNIDLLVLVHNKHSFFENLLFTPVVRNIVHHASVPFMILPPFKTTL